ncbi:MAG: Anaphase-promoting complex subunit 1 [Bogoriella megaspora]|nr:MAG: Anaphase-promoting complex subunit 1 [Bogoriella megaspora]
MASVNSLGVHTPSALPYLIAEGILPKEPAREQYQWQSYDCGEDETWPDEIITTDYCVVLSRGSFVQKTFRFEVEQQKVRQAVLTWFKSTDVTASVGLNSSGDLERVEAASKDSTEPAATSATEKFSIGSKSNRQSSQSHDGTSDIRNAGYARALVVLLATQAHVFFLSGPSHIVNLPFEVDGAFPTPWGLILQRKIEPSQSVQSSSGLPPAPSNSFLSSQPLSNPASQQPAGFSSRTDPARFTASASVSRSENEWKSRHFCLSDPLAGFGLVVLEVRPTQSERRRIRASRFNNGDPAEELIFVSSSNELLGSGNQNIDPVTLSVTLNAHSGTFTIWHTLRGFSKPSSPYTSQANRTEVDRRRRSSFNPAMTTGTTTPAVRIREGNRESFAGAGYGDQSVNPSQRSTVEGAPDSSTLQDAEDIFASQVDPALHGTRHATRQSRRVSSMISRADLSTGPEKINYGEISRGQPQTGNRSSSFGRRAQSLGGQNERASFGGLSSIRSRASTPGSTSRLSFPEDDVMTNDGQGLHRENFPMADLGGIDFNEALDNLPKEIVMLKVDTFAADDGDLSFSQRSQGQSKTNLKVFTTRVLKSNLGDSKNQFDIKMYILNKTTRELAVVTIELHPRAANKLSQLKPMGLRIDEHRLIMIPKIGRVEHFSEINDIAKLRSGVVTNILTLPASGYTPSDQFSLNLHPCSSFEPSLKLPLENFKLFNPFSFGSPLSPSRRDAGIKRRLRPKEPCALENAHRDGLVDVVDSDGQNHQIQIQLEPRSHVWANFLQACQRVLPVEEAEILQVFWCAAQNWLLGLDLNVSRDLESTASCMLLFSMFLGALDGSNSKGRGSRSLRARSTTPQPKKGPTDAWSLMVASQERMNPMLHAITSPWDSAIEDSILSSTHLLSSPAKSTRASKTSPSTANSFIVDTLGITRKFLTEHTWAKVVAARVGWTNTTITACRYASLSIIVRILHLLREESKLDVLNRLATYESKLQGPLIAQMGHWLGWEHWDWRSGNYYELEGASSDQWLFDTSTVTRASPPATLRPDPILQWIEDAYSSKHPRKYATVAGLCYLRCDSEDTSSACKESDAKLSRIFAPRITAVVDFLNFGDLRSSSSFQNVERLAEHGLTNRLLEALPVAVAVPLRDSIIACRANPPTTWHAKLLHLIDREDLNLSIKRKPQKEEDLKLTLPANEQPDLANPPRSLLNDDEYYLSPYKEQYAISKHIYSADKRYSEAYNILDPQTHPVAECRPSPQWSELDLLNAQKEVMHWVMARTTSLYPGHALMHFDAIQPLLTDKLLVPGFSTVCLMKPTNNYVGADRTGFTEEKLSWAFFHAGAAKGISIARDATGINTSWIVSIKPAELNNRHAGLLLALGLNGHLRSMARWLAYKYLTTKHTMTSIGLLLGLCASNLGSMDLLLTRLLSVHVTRMLPPGAAELNLSPLTQTAGLMGTGLLYYNTQHRRMSEIMLSEIEHREFEDPSSGSPNALRDEGYRLAAGFALGLINLAKGKDLRGLHDMNIIERLLAIAVGPKEVDYVHVVDQATAGATVALGLIFLKSGNVALAKKIDIPNTLPRFNYVRPDQFLLRTLVKHLILWDEIKADKDWISRNLLDGYRSLADLSSITNLRSKHAAFYNTLAGLLWSISLKYAGSGSLPVRDFLVAYLDQYIRLTRLPTLHYDARLARLAVRNCQDLIALACATVMAGSGDLIILRRLRLLHGRLSPDVSYGSHLAAHQALGVLFLGSGRYTFGTSDLAIASLVCAFYPLFPTSVLDNKAHLQAFRHFWAFAAEARGILVRDFDTHSLIPLPIAVLLRSGEVLDLKAPVLLPELDTIAQIKTNSPKYRTITLDFAGNPSHLAAFKKRQTIFVQPLPAGESLGSTFHSALIALNDAQSRRTGRLVWDWIFSLPIFRSREYTAAPMRLSRADRALVLSPNVLSSVNTDMQTTIVDARMELYQNSQGWTRDELIELRILFGWAEEVMSREEGRLSWIGQNVIRALKAKIDDRGREIGGVE